MDVLASAGTKDLAFLTHLTEQTVHVVPLHVCEDGDLVRCEGFVGVIQHSQDAASLVTPVNLVSVTLDNPPAGFLVEGDGLLVLLDVTAASVEGATVRIAVEDDRGVGRTAQAKGAGYLLERVMATPNSPASSCSPFMAR